MTTEVKRWRILDRDITLNCPVQQLSQIEQAVTKLKTSIEKHQRYEDVIDQAIMAGLEMAYQCVQAQANLKSLEDETTLWSSHFKQRIQYLLEKDS